MTGTPWDQARLVRGGSRILFGFGYDDEQIELELLPRGRVLVIAAAGEIAAALAASGYEVEAIDINPRQLDYASRRVAGAPAHIGAAEQLLAVGRSLLRIVQPVWSARRVRRLLELPRDRAVPIWRAHFATAALRRFLAASLGPRGLIGILVPQKLGAGIPPGLSSRLLDAIEQRLGNPDNRFLYRLLLGEEAPGWKLPAVPDGSIRWLVGDVCAHLEAASPGSYQGISLSNVADAADAAWVRRLQRAAERALAPGGVAILRTIADDGSDAEHELASRDRSGLWGAIRLWRPQTDLSGRFSPGRAMMEP